MYSRLLCLYNRGLSSFDLKVLAMLCMFIDHFVCIILPEYGFLRNIGRLAFVLFSFLIVEGFVHTQDRNAYSLRLFLFAFLSEIPFDFAFYGELFYWGRQNIFFTLFFAVLSLHIVASSIAKDLKILYIFLITSLATYLRFDFFYLGILQIVFFYVYRSSNFKKLLSVGILNIFYWGKITFQASACLAFVPIQIYNGKAGRRAGLIFYALYPIHLLLFAIIKKMLL